LRLGGGRDSGRGRQYRRRRPDLNHRSGNRGSPTGRPHQDSIPRSCSSAARRRHSRYGCTRRSRPDKAPMRGLCGQVDRWPRSLLVASLGPNTDMTLQTGGFARVAAITAAAPRRRLNEQFGDSWAQESCSVARSAADARTMARWVDKPQRHNALEHDGEFPFLGARLGRMDEGSSRRSCVGAASGEGRPAATYRPAVMAP
jgi:hypothetical protein